jgi:GT2 family glycosyltransferase/glycosyltransferase involved in cell wall biosynthesis
MESPLSADARRDPALDALTDPRLDAVFQHPTRIDRDSAWFGHIPFAFWLMRALQPDLLVELGTHHGISFTAFCQSVLNEGLSTQCFAINTWSGDDRAGNSAEEVYEDLHTYVEQHFAGFSHILRSGFDDALSRFADGSIDLLHIDGLHAYETLRHDVQVWLPKLSDRAVVLFHNTTQRQAEAGVWRLWREVAAQWPAFEFVHGRGLGVLCIGRDAPAAVLDLMALPAEAAGRLRDRFAFFGARWEAESRAGQLRRTLTQRDARLRELATGLDQAKAAEARLSHSLEQARAEAIDAATAETEVARSAEAAEAALTHARSQILELREDLATLQQTQAALRATEADLRLNLATAEDALREAQTTQRSAEAALAGARDHVARLEIDRSLILGSTSWRVAASFTRMAGALPAPVRRQARRAFKAAWWIGTPWKIPARLRVRRELAAHAALALSLNLDTQPVPALLPASLLDEPEPPACEPAAQVDPYARWIEAFEPAVFNQLGDRALPTIALLLPTAAEDAGTAATLDSLLHQTHTDWTLVVPDTVAARQATAKLSHDRRLLRVSCAPELDRGGILAALLASVTDDWVGVLDNGDVLAPDALRSVAVSLASDPGLAAVYADEDVVDAAGLRSAPQFKPAWSPEMLQAFNYFGRLTVFSRPLAESAGGFVMGQGAGAEWGLNLRLSDAALAAGLRIGRLPAVLCHRPPESDRDRPSPGTRAAIAHQRVLHDHWASRGRIGVQVTTQPDGTQRSTWDTPEPPLVSIIVPSNQRPAILRRCLKSVLEKTAYRDIDLVVVGNGSDDPEARLLYRELRQIEQVQVVEAAEPLTIFAACNRGARAARGSLLLFLEGDLEVDDPGWLGEMVRMAMLPGVGVVGAKLVSADGHLLHAGIAAGPGFLGRMFDHAEPAAWGVFGSADHTRNWSAVLGACQMVRRDVFDRVGGFDEGFVVANADVVLSLQAGLLGDRTAFTPFASLTRIAGAAEQAIPAEDMARAARALRELGAEEDPFFHPGLSGTTPVPTLRAPGEPSAAERVRAQSAQLLAAMPELFAELDLFDNGAVLAAIDLPRAHVLPSFSGTAPVEDEWSAARWIVGLLRYRRDLRVRFPRALSEGRDGAFAAWLAEGTRGEILLPLGLLDHLDRLWALDPAARPRQIYAWRDDVHAIYPAGMLPPGYAGLARYLFRSGRFEYGLRLEEAWWLLLSCAEDPAAELVRAYRFNIAWQGAYPLGLTVFGRDRFAAWIAQTYDVRPAARWLDPATWPDLPAPAEQLRLAYAQFPDWRRAHPRAFDSPAEATALLEYLASPAAGLPQPQRRWCAGGMQAGLAAELARPAVNVLGHFCYPSGLRVSVEAMSDALEEAGVTVTRRDVRTRFDSDRSHISFGGLESAGVTVIHVQPGELFLKAYDRADLRERSPRSYRIAYWYWELDEVPPAWAEVARTVDEIWTATSFVADAVRRVVVDRPVRVLFPGVRLAPFTPCPREALGAPARGEGRFAFLFSFHMASIAERKNPLGLIRAFRRAFGPEEPVDLVLKTTSEPRHAAELRALRAAAAGANVTIIDRVFSPEETLALMDGCDAYVSLHRAEGLGLTMAEAMLLGKPVIATRYSGNLEFMDDSNSLLVECEVRPLGRAFPPYDAGARWAEPSEAHAAQLMRRLYDDPEAAADLGRRGQASARRSLALATAGQRMAERLREILSERHLADRPHAGSLDRGAVVIRN